MSSRLEREIECVELGPGKIQIFRTQLCASRTRRSLGGINKTVHVGRNESESVQDDPTFETQSKNSELRDNPLDNETALLKFCSMLKALFLPCTSLALLQPITAYTNTKVQGTY